LSSYDAGKEIKTFGITASTFTSKQASQNYRQLSFCIAYRKLILLQNKTTTTTVTNLV